MSWMGGSSRCLHSRIRRGCLFCLTDLSASIAMNLYECLLWAWALGPGYFDSKCFSVTGRLPARAGLQVQSAAGRSVARVLVDGSSEQGGLICSVGADGSRVQLVVRGCHLYCVGISLKLMSCCPSVRCS